VRRSILAARPDFLFHLAAQPIVRLSYAQPAETYAVNVLGTVHVLDALRQLEKPCAAVFVTSDKCYENREWVYGYREDDPMGGHDPYSSSKGAAEIAIASFRRSFFQDHPVKVASVRAGNVIGGGDWAPDRLLPDCIRALQARQPIPVRNPSSVRPWQHVLEPLSGYLCLAAALTGLPRCDSTLCSAFNFGPRHDASRTVAALVEEVLNHWPGTWKDTSDPAAPHEAALLRLSIDKAQALLGWSPVWGFARTVEQTVSWYRQTAADPATAAALALRQIGDYHADAARAGLSWAAA
jgi:CDP-glucose 4,6-dehydratase